MDPRDLGRRIIVAMMIVIIVLVVLFILGRLLGNVDAQPEALYADIPIDAVLLRLDKRALDDAYSEQMRHLFNIWLRGQASSDKEITTGIRIARRAYNTAAAQIAKREQQLPSPDPTRP